ncbi:MAG: ATP-binding cassette domain-containing protein [Chitinophagaceae bacterium]|nr:ATP-binding cassette domain-containing protein [Chitinophagaceae bacterium]
MLHTSALTFSYKNGKTFKYPPLFCSVEKPLLITGQSGSGKTTLLHLLAGLLKPDQGLIKINGQYMTSLSGPVLDKFRGQYISVVYQHPHFMSALNIRDNIALAPYFSGDHIPQSEIEKLAVELGINDQLYRLPSSLSAGEKQRVSIARALISKPALLLADEPTSSLDDNNARTVTELLMTHSRQNGVALVIVTHDQRVKDFLEYKEHVYVG